MSPRYNVHHTNTNTLHKNITAQQLVGLLASHGRYAIYDANISYERATRPLFTLRSTN